MRLPFHIRTFPIQCTPRTFRTLCVADLPPVADEAHMQCVHPFRRRSFCKDVVSLVGGHLRSDQPEAFTNTVHMCIDRHSTQPKMKHPYARSRHVAYTR